MAGHGECTDVSERNTLKCQISCCVYFTTTHTKKEKQRNVDKQLIRDTVRKIIIRMFNEFRERINGLSKNFTRETISIKKDV